jgi:hypothetical protein
VPVLDFGHSGSEPAPADADTSPRTITSGVTVDVRQATRAAGRRVRRDGAVVTFLSLVVFISFGILVGYRQNLTQAATSALGELHHTCGTTRESGLTGTVFACPSDTTLACRTGAVTSVTPGTRSQAVEREDRSFARVRGAQPACWAGHSPNFARLVGGTRGGTMAWKLLRTVRMRALLTGTPNFPG